MDRSKKKTVSGLIRYQPKGDPADWAAAAKGILATEKPDVIVVMLGINDRMALRLCVGQTNTQARHVKRAWERIQEEAAAIPSMKAS